MKQSRLTALAFCTAMVFFLTSCGGSDSEKKAAADSAAMAPADTTAKAPEAVPANTIVTVPETIVSVRHRIANFTKWLASYEGHDSARLAAGLHNYVIGRGLMDTNMVLVALRADDVAKAKSFIKDPGLKAAMAKGGVLGVPMISINTSFWQDTVHVNTTLRSMTMYAVKDHDAWFKAFQEGKQERLDNGITDRVISNDVDDNKKMSLVTAVVDTAKAFAYYKSDALKARRAASGVVGVPTRFLFNIVKRY